jgi:hypothetical protein
MECDSVPRWPHNIPDEARPREPALRPRFEGPISASSPRLTLPSCASDYSTAPPLLAEALLEHLEESAHAPLHLFNIAGGTAVDSLNALILIQFRRPQLLRRPVKILVFDIHTIGPSFGAKAAEVLQQPSQPLAGIDLQFTHQPYDWNDPTPLESMIRQSAKQGAIIAASSEGALFEYGDDAVIFSNLRAIHLNGSGAKLIVGSVTAGDDRRRASVKRAHFKLVPRNIENFGQLVGDAGFALQTIEMTPLSY